MNIRHPQTLFLIDGIGALLSASMLGLVLTSWQSVFGMPKNVLYVLAFIACLFAVNSLFCFWRKSGNEKIHLQRIAIANLAYTGLTLGLMVVFYQQLTIWGLTYFVLELIIVVALALIELAAARAMGRN